MGLCEMVASLAKKIFAVGLFIMLAACQSVVRTDIETYRKSAPLPSGSIYVTTVPAEESKSLEFSFYRDKLAAKLVEAGFTPQPTADDSTELVATLSYGVLRQEKDEPNSRVIIGGHFGYYPYYPRASILVSDLDHQEFEFVRDVTLTITRNDDASEQLFQVKASSIGQCKHLNVVFDEMLEAIFQNLARENGSVEKVRVKGDARCP